MYTATLTRGKNRTYFSIDFRHPVKKDRAGRFGLKVRRGLGTDDEEIAQQYLLQINALLADESLHRPTARAEALVRFSPVVVDAFYRDLDPVASSRSADRDRQLPLPTASDGYATVLLIGTTASGKSTLVRQFLGTQPDERFPSTAPGRTTVSDQEFVLNPDGDYAAVVSFLPRDLVAAKVEDALVDAALAHLSGRSVMDVARLMLSPREGRFRLSYLLGSARSAVAASEKQSTELLDDGDDEVIGEGSQTARPSRVLEFTTSLVNSANEVALMVARARGVHASDLFVGADRDSVEQDVDAGLRDSSSFTELVDDILDEIALRFADVEAGDFDGRSNGWPQSWSIRMQDSERANFIAALRPFVGINAAQHGSLLTPLVEGIRIAGPFQPKWLGKDEALRLVLIDGEGVGHNPETLRSLPGSVTDRMSTVDQVLLVDSASQPMLEGPTLVARTLERLGESAKLHLCFTHIDSMKDAENLPTLADKAAHVRDSAREVLHHLAREFGRPHLPDLERALDERAFFVAAIHQEVPEKARYTRSQLSSLADALRYAPPEPAIASTPIYDPDNIVIAIVAAASEYIETYRALLRLPSQRSLNPVAWQTAKAATRYASQFGMDGYGSFSPAADFATMLGERLARFLAKPIRFEPSNCTEDAKESATARVRQELAKRLDPWIRELLLSKPLTLWVRAYEHRGAGSTRMRALDIDVLNLASVPPSSEEGDEVSTRFRAEVKDIVVAAIDQGGGKLHETSVAAR